MKKSKANKASPRSINAVDIYIGARMRERRLALNLSQAGLGEVLGVSFQQVQKYEGKPCQRGASLRDMQDLKPFTVVYV
jgi:predicted transcriptional regulator